MSIEEKINGLEIKTKIQLKILNNPIKSKNLKPYFLI